ncbi:MAG TPA: type II toxin-antitoxin system VapC family toxin [Gemmatimonadales bacterium]|jgi:ribonuclease VapC|nr:type II toxin-antitoxin system VapC family toxin [Gemmatimonadales bacterium]
MILDSSALVAIALKEPGYEGLLDAIAAAPRVAIGAPTLVETAVIISARLGRDARGLIGRLLLEADIAVIPFSDAHFGTAIDAWLRYGPNLHAASLNFGHCLAYAAARVANEPLLFTGEALARTDVTLAIPSQPAN